MTARSEVGGLLKQWRHRRRMSQLDLAVEADVSTRHLSFVETGRSRPSRELLLHLAEHLDVPLRDRNTLLLAAGFAPAYRETRPRRRRDGAGARRPREDPRQPRAVPGGHRRPPVEPGVGEPAGHGHPHRRRGRRAAGAAGQRAAGEPAPRRPGAAHRQPGRVERPPPHRLHRQHLATADPELAAALRGAAPLPGRGRPADAEHDAGGHALRAARAARAAKGPTSTSSARWPPSARPSTSPWPSSPSSRSSPPTSRRRRP